MTRVAVCLLWVATGSMLSCSQSTPPIDTPATLPPAEPPADVTRTSSGGKAADKAADAGKPEPQQDAAAEQKP